MILTLLITSILASFIIFLASHTRSSNLPSASVNRAKYSRFLTTLNRKKGKKSIWFSYIKFNFELNSAIYLFLLSFSDRLQLFIKQHSSCQKPISTDQWLHLANCIHMHKSFHNYQKHTNNISVKDNTNLNKTLLLCLQNGTVTLRKPVISLTVQIQD